MDGKASLSASDWDRQFAAGGWDYLEGLEELAHHSVVAGYIARCTDRNTASILDMGCGEGTLQKLLFRYGDYLGVDWSSVAIEKAQTREDENTRFVVGDANTFSPPQDFDVIVFGECLYYLRSPVEALFRYAQYLKPGGFIVISMYVESKNEALWESIAAHFKIQDKVRITHMNRTAWDVGIIRPAAGS